MPRIHEIPAIEVHIMENNEKPGGVGEPGLPAFAPALYNAIFDLTGVTNGAEEICHTRCVPFFQ